MFIMALLTERMQSLHTLKRNTFVDDCSVQGILKSSSSQRCNKNIRPQAQPYVSNQLEYNQRNDDGKRLVRFCDTKENKTQHRLERVLKEEDNKEVIMFCNNMYLINNSDPNSAVRKLFPNSKLTPINPFINRTNITNACSLMTPKITKNSNDNHSLLKCMKNKSENLDSSRRPIKRITNRNVPRRKSLKAPIEIESQFGKTNETTPLIERIKQLTCDIEETNEKSKAEKDQTILDSSIVNSYKSFEINKPFNAEDSNNFNLLNETFRDLPKQTKEGLNLMKYSQHILLSRSEPSQNIRFCQKKSNLINEAGHPDISTLSQENKDLPGDRTSIATCSTTGDTIYSLSDIDEALTDEERDMKEAFLKNNKQDELELFVQQDASRTERLKKRYSSNLKPENGILAIFPKSENSLKNQNIYLSQISHGNYNMKAEKPKFCSTVEILQQLQQQIETPYQLEGRRTACSNYSTDSSIPISERLFCDESSDCYETIPSKLSVHRTCSHDSKNYEDIDNFPFEFSIQRSKSQEYFSHLDSNPYFYPITPGRCTRNLGGDTEKPKHSMYTSSLDLHSYNTTTLSDRFIACNSHPTSSRQLHPVLQKQYCRFPMNKVSQKPVEESKVLTPPSRMHTYMNVPANAPCYLSPPPYSQPNNHNVHPPAHPDIYYCEKSSGPSNIYQNVPFQTNLHMIPIQRQYTERERGVPEGASSFHDSKDILPPLPKEFYSSPNTATIPKPFSLPHHYCVDV